MKMKQFGLTDTKLFHFHRIFKTGGREGGSSEPLQHPLDPPLDQCVLPSTLMGSINDLKSSVAEYVRIKNLSWRNSSNTC